MVARSRTRPPTLTSSTCSRTRSQPRSLLSIARLNQGEVAGSALHLEPNPDRPHVLRLQRARHDCPPPLQTLVLVVAARCAWRCSPQGGAGVRPIRVARLSLPRVPSKSSDLSDSGRSAVSAGTSLHAPKRAFHVAGSNAGSMPLIKHSRIRFVRLNSGLAAIRNLGLEGSFSRIGSRHLRPKL